MRFGLGAKFTVTVLLILTGTMAANRPGCSRATRYAMTPPNESPVR